MASNSTLSALRLLILSPCQSLSTDSIGNDSTTPSPFPPLLTALTSTAPASDLTSFAGYTSHPPLYLKTRYYERNVGIWCDQLPPVSAPKGQSRLSSSTADTTAGGSMTEESLPSSSSSPSASRVRPVEGLPSSPVEPLASSPVKTTTASSTEDPMLSASETEPPEQKNELMDPPTLKTWKSQFLSPLATEVLASIGAIILILPIPNSPSYPSTPAERVGLMEYISAVNEVKDTIEDLGRDVGTLFLLQPAAPRTVGASDGKREVLRRLEVLMETFEDKCHEMGVFGWDFVWWDGVPESEASMGMPKVEIVKDRREDGGEMEKKAEPVRNEYGEKLGIERVKEVLEGVDWSISPSLTTDPVGEDSGDENGSFDVFGGNKYKGLDAELQQEMMGLKLSMMDSGGTKTDTSGEQDGEDMSIDQMSALMQRVVSIREASADLDKGDREKFAKREVEKIMRELG